MLHGNDEKSTKSQVSPIPSPSLSCWFGLAEKGQLSIPSIRPSSSKSEQTSPIPSPFKSDWLGFDINGQLSVKSKYPSLSLSAKFWSIDSFSQFEKIEKTNNKTYWINFTERINDRRVQTFYELDESLDFKTLPNEEKNISVTQNDVRAVQLAKAALYAGVRLLMDYLETDQIDSIQLAGAFGIHIDTTRATFLGLIPDCQTEKVSSVGKLPIWFFRSREQPGIQELDR